MPSSHTPAPRCQWFSTLAKALDPRSARRLAVLFLGVILGHGRRTVRCWIRAAGLSNQYRRCYATVAAVGRRTERMATRLLLELIKPLGEVWEPSLNKEVAMNKKYVVRLSEEERGICEDIIKHFKGSSQKFRRAQILLKADADGPGWPDVKIAEAFNCRVQTIENLRKRLVTESFALALDGKKRQEPPTPCKLDGEGEAKVIALRLGKPPAGCGRWTLRLLAEQVVELEIVKSISHETVRQMLKKRHDEAQNRVLGNSSRSRRGIRRQHGRSAGNLRETV